MARHKSSAVSKRIEAMKLMADNESSEEEEEEKAETTNIAAEANKTNKKQRKEETYSQVYSTCFKINSTKIIISMPIKYFMTPKSFIWNLAQRRFISCLLSYHHPRKWTPS